MTERELKIFFTGTYQISQAVSYLAEMVDTGGNLRIEYVKDERWIKVIKGGSTKLSTPNGERQRELPNLSTQMVRGKGTYRN